MFIHKLIILLFLITSIAFSMEDDNSEENFEDAAHFIDPDQFNSDKPRQTKNETRSKWKKVFKGPRKKSTYFNIFWYQDGERNGFPERFSTTEFPHYFVYKKNDIYKIDIPRNKKLPNGRNGALIILPKDTDAFIIDEVLTEENQHRLVKFQKDKRKPTKDNVQIDEKEIDYRNYYSLLNRTEEKYQETSKMIEQSCKWIDIIKKYSKNELKKLTSTKVLYSKSFCIGLVECKNEVEIFDRKIEKGNFVAYCAVEENDCPNLGECVQNLNIDSINLRKNYDIKTKQFIK